MATGFVKRRANGSLTWLYRSRSRQTSERVRDVRWGDFLNIVQDHGDGFSEIAWGQERLFIASEDIASARPLEVLFVDVGQGDGCIVIPPESGAQERILVVDAGQQANMLGMLRWRFGKLARIFRFHAAVVTHPDQDHYLGFQAIFRHVNAHFDRVYHNGLGERSAGGPATLGNTDASGRYLDELIVHQADMDALYAPAGPNLGKRYGRLMRTALDSGRIGDIRMLAVGHGQIEGGRTWLPQFAPADARACTIEVLGPVPEPDPSGRPRLRWFGSDIGSNARDVGKTKNGHSILLRLEVGGLRILLGGDLNRPAEDYLLRQHAGIPASAPLSDAVLPARARLGADILKCCHHGAADVTDEFLQAVNPFAFVVSSGDDESHAHPRPDLLGRLGKQGRGPAPLLLCTELLRSTREQGRAEDFSRLHALDAEIGDAATTPARKAAAIEERRALQDLIQRRNVGVYGAITVRSDGDHVEISFMLERPRGRQRWQTYRLARAANGDWTGDLDGH